MPAFVNNSGSWREVSRNYIFNEGVWKTTTPAIRDNGVWKEPTPPVGLNPIIDVSTRNDTINPAPSTIINSTIGSPTYAATWVNSASIEDGFGNDRGYINNSGDLFNGGWRFSTLANDLNTLNWSCYVECEYRGFNSADSNNWAFRLQDSNGDEIIQISALSNTGNGTFDVLTEYLDTNGDVLLSVVIEAPINDWIIPGPPSKKYILVRFNVDRIDVQLNWVVPGSQGESQVYQASNSSVVPVSSSLIRNVDRIDNVWVGSTGYKWFRMSFFDYPITDAYYLSEVRGRESDYPMPPVIPFLPTLDYNLQNTTENPVASQLLSPRFQDDPTDPLSFELASGGFDDGVGTNRGYVNGGTDIGGWQQVGSGNLVFGDFSLYFECEYRGSGSSASSEYGFRLSSSADEDNSAQYFCTIEELSTTVNFRVRRIIPGSGTIIELSSIPIPKTGPNGWESGNPIRHLIRMVEDPDDPPNRGSYDIQIEINGAIYSDSGTQFLQSLRFAFDLFSGVSAYKWYRCTYFDQIISDSYYNNWVRGRRDDYPTP